MLRPTGYIKPIHLDGNRYGANAVMKVIGRQIFPTDTEAMREAQKIIDAHKPGLISGSHRGEEICSTVYDAFLLGMIYGKRAERQKRRQKATA